MAQSMCIALLVMQYNKLQLCLRKYLVRPKNIYNKLRAKQTLEMKPRHDSGRTVNSLHQSPDLHIMQNSMMSNLS